ncbi:hypothetical protein [Nostoc sp. NMS2]|nr:hypothetical protein [Nostoc sp. NMS2]
MPQPISSGIGVVGIASVVLGTAEKGNAWAGNDYFVSGSVVRGDRTLTVACPPGKECSYLEMGDFAGKQGGLYGKRWASGSSQQVRGGYGFLAAVNGGFEPTGRLVYGSGFKVALTGVTALPAIMQYSFFPCPLLSKLSDLGMYLIAAVSAVMNPLGLPTLAYSLGSVRDRHFSRKLAPLTSLGQFPGCP